MFSGQWSSASNMRARCQAPGVTVVALLPSAGPVPPRDDRGDAAAERLFHDLRADQMHVTVDGARGEDQPVARDHFGGRADDEVGLTPGMMSGLPAFPMP